MNTKSNRKPGALSSFPRFRPNSTSGFGCTAFQNRIFAGFPRRPRAKNVKSFSRITPERDVAISRNFQGLYTSTHSTYVWRESPFPLPVCPEMRSKCQNLTPNISKTVGGRRKFFPLFDGPEGLYQTPGRVDHFLMGLGVRPPTPNFTWTFLDIFWRIRIFYKFDIC